MSKIYQYLVLNLRGVFNRNHTGVSSILEEEGLFNYLPSAALNSFCGKLYYKIPIEKIIKNYVHTFATCHLPSG